MGWAATAAALFGRACSKYRAHGWGETWCIHCGHDESDHLGKEKKQKVLPGTEIDDVASR